MKHYSTIIYPESAAVRSRKGKKKLGYKIEMPKDHTAQQPSTTLEIKQLILLIGMKGVNVMPAHLNRYCGTETGRLTCNQNANEGEQDGRAAFKDKMLCPRNSSIHVCYVGF